MKSFYRIMPVRGIFSMLILLASVFPVYSQNPSHQMSLERFIEQRRKLLDNMLSIMDEKLGCELICPQGWTKEIFTIGFDQNYEMILLPASYRIVSPQRDVIAICSFFKYAWDIPEDSVKDGQIGKKLSDPSYGRQPVQYSPDYSRENFGADYAGQYPKSSKYCVPPYEVRNTDKYPHCEAVWLYKNNLGLVDVEYHYKTGTDIDKYIKETAGMFRFREGFIPPPQKPADPPKGGGKITFQKQE